MKRYIHYLIAIIIGLLVGILPACNSNKSPADEFPVFLKAILDFTDTLERLPGEKASELDKSNELIKEFNKRLSEDYSNARGHFLLAQAYQGGMNFRKAIKHFEIATNIDSELADPHLELGNLYYELALLDMVVRELYERHTKGYLLLKPDATTKQIFKKAIDEFNIGFKLKKNLTLNNSDGTKIIFTDPQKAAQRLRQASIYISGASDELIFTEDQAKAVIWMMQLEKHFPASLRLRQADEVLKFYSNSSDEGRKGLPDALPLQPKKKTDNGILKWMDVGYNSKINSINLSHRDDKQQLRSAVALAWNIVKWSFVSSVSDKFSESRDEIQKLIASTAKEIFLNAENLGIKLDQNSVQILRKGESDTEKRRYMMGQIDQQFDILGPKSAVVNIYNITSNHMFILIALSMTPTEKWSSNWKNLSIYWQILKQFAITLSISTKKVEVLDQIKLKLLAAANQRDIKAIDISLRELNEWYNSLIQYVLDTCKASTKITNIVQLDHLIRNGIESEKNDKPEIALKYFERALVLNPHSFNANFGKGNALFSLNQFLKAIEAYDMAIEEEPNNVGALHNRELARLRASGLSWPNGEHALKFLKKDIMSNDRKVRLGAVLMLGSKDSYLLEAEFNNNPKLFEEFKSLEFPE